MALQEDPEASSVEILQGDSEACALYEAALENLSNRLASPASTTTPVSRAAPRPHSASLASIESPRSGTPSTQISARGEDYI